MVEDSIFMKTLISTFVVLAFALTAPWAAAEDDEEEGFSYQEKLEGCFACHGENGDQPLAPEYPVLAGQYADYLEESLKAYREGRRTNPIMTQQVEFWELSDSDIARLADYFASKPGLKNLQYNP